MRPMRADWCIATREALQRAARHGRPSRNFAFIKFCKSVTDDPFSGELSAGMYLPLDYFDKLATAGRLVGERGGPLVTYENVRRWMNNSLFISLVERSWVGTRGLTSDQITAVIEQSLAAKHSAIVATGRSMPSGARR